MITNKGKELIARYLTGLSSTWAGAMEFGVGETAASATDESLDFPVVRVPVNLIDYDASTYEVTVRATLPEDAIGTFYEVGIFSDEGFPEQEVGNTLLLEFNNETVYDVDSANISAANARVGSAGYLISTVTTGYVRGFKPNLDLAGYSGNDVINLAYNYTDTGGTPTVAIRFETTDTDYYEHTFTPTAGYNIETVLKSAMSAVGSPNWANISAIYVAVNDQADLLLDGVSFEDTINIQTYGMIARSVVTPLVKPEFVETEATFKLDLNF